MSSAKKTGRPTKYLPEYCDKLIEHMSSGLSFETFAAKIKVNRDTLYAWEKKHKAFSDAKKVGIDQGQLVWEEMGLAAMAGGIKGFNTVAWIFWGKNRFGMRDAPEQVATANVELNLKIGHADDNEPDINAS